MENTVKLWLKGGRHQIKVNIIIMRWTELMHLNDTIRIENHERIRRKPQWHKNYFKIQAFWIPEIPNLPKSRGPKELKKKKNPIVINPISGNNSNILFQTEKLVPHPNRYCRLTIISPIYSPKGPFISPESFVFPYVFCLCTSLLKSN